MKTVKYVTDIPYETNELLKEAAQRERRSKNNFILGVLEDAAKKEKAKQQDQ